MLPYFRKCIINTFSIDYHLWQATKSSARTLCYLAVKPQVTFASLSSPAVMDIRRLRRRSLEIISIYKMRKFK